MIEIKVTIDPREINKHVMRRTAQYLLALCGDELAMEAPPQIIPAVNEISPPFPGNLPHPSFLPTSDVSTPPEIKNIFSQPIEPLKPHELPDNTHGIPFMEMDSSVEYDKAGIAWDSRIHARTKTKNKEGEWKLKRGINETVVQKVKKELRGAKAAPLVDMIPPPPPLFSADTKALPEIDFPSIVGKASTAIGEQRMTQAQLLEILNKFGIESTPVLATRPDLFLAVDMALDNFLRNA